MDLGNQLAVLQRKKDLRLPYAGDVVHDWDAELGVTVTGALVDSWQSQTGTGKALTATSTKRPTLVPAAIGGRAAISFDGANNVLASTAEVHAQPNTLFLVMQLTNVTAAAFQTILNGPSGSRHLLRKRNTTDGRITMYAGGTLPDSTVFMQNDTTYVVCARFNTTNSDLRFNGAQVIAPFSAGAENLSDMFLGAADAAVGSPMPGKIARFVVYESFLSDVQTAAVEKYLTKLYS